MAYTFPLATVLKVRENIEEREERALQKIRSEMSLVENEIESLAAQIARAHLDREESMTRPMPAAYLHAMLADTQAAADKRKSLVTYLSTLEQQRLQQVKVYQAANRDRETLTNMSDEQRDIYEQEQTRSQQKTLDDIFMARRHRS